MPSIPLRESNPDAATGYRHGKDPDRGAQPRGFLLRTLEVALAERGRVGRLGGLATGDVARRSYRTVLGGDGYQSGSAYVGDGGEGLERRRELVHAWVALGSVAPKPLVDDSRELGRDPRGRALQR